MGFHRRVQIGLANTWIKGSGTSTALKVLWGRLERQDKSHGDTGKEGTPHVLAPQVLP